MRTVLRLPVAVALAVVLTLSGTACGDDEDEASRTPPVSAIAD